MMRGLKKQTREGETVSPWWGRVDETSMACTGYSMIKRSRMGIQIWRTLIRGSILKVPDAYIPEAGARVMSLTDGRGRPFIRSFVNVCS